MLDETDNRLLLEMRVGLNMAATYIMEMHQKLDEAEEDGHLDMNEMYEPVFKAHAPLCRMHNTNRLGMRLTGYGDEEVGRRERACLEELNERYEEHGGQYEQFAALGDE